MMMTMIIIFLRVNFHQYNKFQMITVRSNIFDDSEDPYSPGNGRKQIKLARSRRRTVDQHASAGKRSVTLTFET